MSSLVLTVVHFSKLKCMRIKPKNYDVLNNARNAYTFFFQNILSNMKSQNKKYNKEWIL